MQKNNMKPLLLNADLGEGFAYDADIMPLIDIANIACGEHAGDLSTVQRTVAMAVNAGIGRVVCHAYAEADILHATHVDGNITSHLVTFG